MGPSCGLFVHDAGTVLLQSQHSFAENSDIDRFDSLSNLGVRFVLVTP